MKRKHWILGLLISASVLTTTKAMAFELGVMAGGNFSSISETPSVSTNLSGNTGLGYGAFLSHSLAGIIGLEYGALYMKQGFKTTTSGIDSTRSANYLTIPVLVRFGFLPAFDVGAGLYYGFGMGDVSTTVSGTTTTTAFSDTTLKSSDYGWIASARYKQDLVPMFSLFVDGRYAMGMNKVIETSTSSSKFKSFQVFAGALFGF